ncbi:hypothetical protein L598_008200000030 [Mesorhizobium sp. J18]|uniref:hypothetical protein n=1 Tax=Mesorhizobium sp. J18 TaxID=935263 RepID=UPI001198E168|nr:hypothetical protein [Mesorhizobium sp. J18]TWG89433.1 hypothetical protein L598_008200000030 [Mesorhizobium sp. J18]
MNAHKGSSSSRDYTQRQPIGLASYQRSFGLKFIHESDPLPDTDPRTRILVSTHRYGMPSDLAGKSVAVVGNGCVQNSGKLIDGCDEVIRISTMRNWNRASEHDGVKTTIWAGHPWLVVRRKADGELAPNPRFAELARAGSQLWAASPFHISVDSYRWLKAEGHLERLLVAPPPAEIYEIGCSYFDAEELRLLFSIARQRKNVIGFSNFDLLLTGTRIVLMLELCGVTRISLFGTNLFGFSRDGVWFGHDLMFDYKVLMRVRKRLKEKGGEFHWPDERSVKKSMIFSKFRFSI